MSNVSWNAKTEKQLTSLLQGDDFAESIEEAIEKQRLMKQPARERISRALRLEQTDSVLEIGSGFGVMADWLAPSSKSYCCIDVSDDFLAVAKKTVKSDNVTFVKIAPGDFSHLNGRTFTKVFSQGLYIHFNLYDIFDYSTQIYELLKPGGLYYFQYCNSESSELLNHKAFQKHFSAYKGNKKSIFNLHNFNSPKSVTSVLQHLGFDVLEQHQPEWIYPWILCRRPPTS